MIPRHPDEIRRAAGALAAVRLGLGLLAVGAPKLGRHLFGFTGKPTPESRLTFALFGIREVVLGGAVLAAVRSGYPSPRLLRLNAACDAADAAVIASAARRRDYPLALLALPVSASVTLAWMWFAHGMEHPDPLGPETV